MDSSAADDPQQEGSHAPPTIPAASARCTSGQGYLGASNPPNPSAPERLRRRTIRRGPRCNLAAWSRSARTSTPPIPLAAAPATGADAAQFFLADPQGWKAPVEHPHAAEIRASDLTIYIHAPYLVNVATMNNKIRIPSRKILSQHAAAATAIGAKGLIVHGGHVLNEDDYDKPASTTGARPSRARRTTAASGCRS